MDTITLSVEIPKDRHLALDLSLDVPAGEIGTSPSQTKGGAGNQIANLAATATFNFLRDVRGWIFLELMAPIELIY